MNILNIVSLFLSLSCNSVPEKESGSKPVSHQIWDQLLKKHVGDNGKVNYKGFIEDSTKLNQYIELISSHYPFVETLHATSLQKDNDQYWSREQQMAYWINAYNAFTVQLVIRHYPVKSIRDIGSKFQVTFINTVWDIEFINIEGAKMDLNNIEHGILRKKFNDPRIHFAIVCASNSCPKLKNEAYTASKLTSQLNDQAAGFINDPTRNKITPGNIAISKIFNWFEGDFTKKGSLIDFLNKYSETRINSNAKISHLDYDWGLNE